MLDQHKILHWQDKPIGELHSLVLVQAYETCLAQEQKRELAKTHEKFTRQDGKAIKLPAPNPHFLNVKQELLNEINKRNIKLDTDNV